MARAKRSRRCGAAALLGAALWAPSCASPPVSAAQREAEEQRLRAPYQQARAVVADQIHFDISANFDADVARPAVDPGIAELHRAVEAGDVVYSWASRGGLQVPLKFQVGSTTFAALIGATLRIRGSGKPFALSVVARGRVTESATGAPLIDCDEVSIADGVYHRR